MEALQALSQSWQDAVATTCKLSPCLPLIMLIHTPCPIQVIAIFLIVAIGLDQSKTTARWRLLLMSEKEEMAWSHKR